MKPTAKKVATRGAFAVLAPLIIMGGYLYLSRSHVLDTFSVTSDYLALAVALLAFVGAIFTLPLSGKQKFLIIGGGAPALLLALVWASFLFLAVFFHEGL